jgi:hypothetical protein
MLRRWIPRSRLRCMLALRPLTGASLSLSLSISLSLSLARSLSLALWWCIAELWLTVTDNMFCYFVFLVDRQLSQGAAASLAQVYA